MSEIAQNFASTTIGIILGTYLGSRIMEFRIKKMLQKYGVTENKIRNLIEGISQLTGVEI
jgi:plasmid maintenance system antidote protein VapI